MRTLKSDLDLHLGHTNVHTLFDLFSVLCIGPTLDALCIMGAKKVDRVVYWYLRGLPREREREREIEKKREKEREREREREGACIQI